jgi:predicted RNase H-like HicB family nuclease
MASYIALIHKDADSDFGVSFPDFPGCITAGSSIDEAKNLAQEALEFHVEGMVEDGDVLPEPSSLEAVMRERDNRDAVAFLVTLPRRQARVVRVNITIPEDALLSIDRYAEAHGYTRSGFIVKAAKKAVEEAL